MVISGRRKEKNEKPAHFYVPLLVKRTKALLWLKFAVGRAGRFPTIVISVVYVECGILDVIKITVQHASAVPPLWVCIVRDMSL